jgi:CSLREA domain-containing protein
MVGGWSRAARRVIVSVLVALLATSAALVGGLAVSTLPASATAASYTFVREFGSSGSGDGQFNGLYDVAVSASGLVYGSDGGNKRVLVYDAGGTFVHAFGSEGTGPGQFGSGGPYGVAVAPDGTVYVVDNNNHRIEHFDADGTYLNAWGSQGSANGQFWSPTDVGVDANGNIYVADTINRRVQKFNSSGQFQQVWNTRWNPGEFPYGIGVSPDAVYVSDSTDRVQKFAFDGTFITQWGTHGAANDQFDTPQDLEADAFGRVIVTDRDNQRVKVFDSTGQYLTTIQSPHTVDGRFGDMIGVAVDASGTVYLPAYSQEKIEVFDAVLAQHALTVTPSGAGAGTVTSSPPGIDCGATCSASFDDGTSVTLHAQHNAGSVFAGWSGDCAGTGDCVVTMDQARAVTATFAIDNSPSWAVNTSADHDDGACTVADCTLREAINRANSVAGTHTITFAIPGSGVHTIRPTTDLPAVSTTAVVDATTQPGYSGSPLIELDGTLDTTGNRFGLWVTGTGSTIEGFVVNRFGSRGILVDGSNNTVRANFVGTTADGSAALGDFAFSAVEIRGGSNTVGGSTAADRNVIADILFVNNFGGSGAPNNVVRGNYLGLNAAGTAGIGGGAGLWLGKSTNTTVGGNVISGNTGNGIQVDINATGAVIRGNYFGTNAAGTAAVPNGAGLQVYGPGTVIGGTAPGEGNVVAGNTGDGIRLQTDHAVVAGNSIGVGVGGVALGNGGAGVSLIGTESHHNTVGGTAAGAGNTIANNVSDGISVINGTGQTLEGNQISDNSGLAIDINNDGVTLNDAGDGDSGQNNKQNFPVVTTAQTSATATHVAGALDSAAGTYRVEVFANPVCDASGYGEAKTFLGAITGVSAGSFSGDVGSATVGDQLSATATNEATGDTSELSQCTPIAAAPADGPSLTVNKTDDHDDGACTLFDCTLREAINRSNSLAGADTILFNIPNVPDGPPHTIVLTSPLPTITDAGTINGESEPDYAGVPVVFVDGSALSGFSSGLVVTAANTTLRGLGMVRFPWAAVSLQGPGGDVVEDSYLGIAADGQTAAGNVFGVLLSTTNGNTIRNNVISGNQYGLRAGINTGGDNVVTGNKIGTNAAGSAAVGNGTGIEFEGDEGGNTIGGTLTAGRNVISGNQVGIRLSGSADNVVAGNYVGTDVNGMLDLGNANQGIGITDLTLGATVRPATNNVVGGTAAGSRNLISGNGSPSVVGHGVLIDASGNRVRGNLIGTDVTGNAPLGNARGVELQGPDNIVGGPGAADGNVIAGNFEIGVMVAFDANGNAIQGNNIGVGDDDTTAMGNGAAGVWSSLTTSGAPVLVGGTGSTAGNVIAYNGSGGSPFGGVFVSSGSGLSVLGNSIHDNVDLGIDLDPLGVTANDAGDADSGPNGLQNFPSISATSGNPGTITGQLDSGAGTYRIEFFKNGACDASGNGEGATYLGSVDTASNAAFSFDAPLSVGDVVTATATAPNGSTSEFSPCTTTTVASIATTTDLTSSVNPSGLGQPVTFTATVNSASGAPNGSVKFYDGLTLLGTVSLDANGVASVTVASLSLGSHDIEAQYLGSPPFLPSTDSLVQEVTVSQTGTRWCKPLGRWVDFASQPCGASGTQQPPYGSITTTAAGTAYVREPNPATHKDDAFPYTASTDGTFPTSGNFVLDFALRYDELAPHGTGVHAHHWSDATPSGTNSPYASGAARCSAFGVWADSASGLRLNFSGKTVSLGAPGALHSYRLAYLNGRYLVFVDGQLKIGPIAVGDSERVDRFWLGNPVITDWTPGTGPDWTDFTVKDLSVSQPASVDIDNNGVDDAVQNWPVTNVPANSQVDTDGDGLPNHCDPQTTPPPASATITILKATDPAGDSQQFAFSGALSGSIADGGMLEADVTPGTQTVTEALTTGWDMTSVECDDSDSTGNAATRTVTFHTDNGEHVTCVVTNTKRPVTPPPTGTDMRWCQPSGQWVDFGVQPCGASGTQPAPYGTITDTADGTKYARGPNPTTHKDDAFPYVTSPDGTFGSSGNFVLDFSMRYDSLQPHGDGFVAHQWPDATPSGTNSPYVHGDAVCSAFGIWGASNIGVRLGFSGQTVQIANPTAFHDYRLAYLNGKYMVFVDGQLRIGPITVGESVRVDRFWIGNPVITDWAPGTGPDWTDFTVANVSVTEPDFVDIDTNGVDDGVQAWTPQHVPANALLDTDNDGLPNHCDSQTDPPHSTATITLIKSTEPQGDAQQFAFTGALAGTIGDGQQLQQEVAAGTYVVTESATPGWDFVHAECDDGDSTGDPTNRTITFRASGGENITCVVTNHRQPSTITVVKETEPEGSTQPFSFTASYDVDGFALADGQSNESEDIGPGTYSVSETVPAGWDQVSATCSDGSDPSAIALAAGEHVTCTFTNTLLGRIEVEKQTTPAGYGGFQFTGDLSGTLADDEALGADVRTGTYSVTEVLPAFYWRVFSISCNDADSSGSTATKTATFHVDPGETVRCVFTNFGTAFYQVQKVSLPAGGTDFPFKWDDAPLVFDLNDQDLATTSSLAGTKTLREQAKPGWRLVDVSCNSPDASGDVQTASATYNLVPGQTVKCTFTNEQLATLTIKKVTDSSVPTDTFTFAGDVGGQVSGSNDLTVQVPTGTYSTTEQIDPNYFLSGVQCDDTDSTGDVPSRTVTFVAAPGEHVTCTVTNTHWSTVRVDKTTLGGDGTFDFALTNNPVQSITTAGRAGSTTWANLVPGDYTITEAQNIDFLLNPAVVCRINGFPIPTTQHETELGQVDGVNLHVAPGQDIVCGFQNVKVGKIIVHKAVDKDPDPHGLAGDPAFHFTGTLGVTTNLRGGEQFESHVVPNAHSPIPGLSLSESEDAMLGWRLDDISCVDPTGGTTKNVAQRRVQFVVDPGETVECTFLNHWIRADLALEIVPPSTPLLGLQGTMGLKVANNGPDASPGYTVTATIPANLTLGALPSGCSLSVSTLTCTRNTLLAAGSTAPPIDIPVTTFASGPLCTIWGTAGNDTLATLTGTAGNDVICGLGGNDTINAGLGTDVVYGDTPSGFVAPQVTVTGTVTGPLPDPIPENNTDSEAWTVADAPPGNDTIYGDVANAADVTTGVSDTLDGQGADDTIYGQGGVDTIVGGLGSDNAYGGNANDNINGDAASNTDATTGVGDVLVGGLGADSIRGQGGADFIYGDVENASDVGTGDGDTLLDGGDAGDFIYGQGGIDTIVGGLGSDNAYGGNANDNINGDAAPNTDTTTGVGDVLVGGLGADSIRGQGGADTIYGDVENASDVGTGDGDTLLDGGVANDTIYGQGGNDTINGGADADTANGGTANDTIYGDVQSNTDSSSGVGDTLIGGVGADSIRGQGGADTIYGDVQNPADVGTGDGDTLLDGGNDGDSIYGQGGPDIINGGAGSDTASGGNAGDTIYGDVQSNTDITTGAGDPSLDGGAGNDVIRGQGGNDTITGGLDNDTLVGGAGSDSISGGGDDDTIYGDIASTTDMATGVGDSLLDGGNGADAIYGQGGNDVINGGGGPDRTVSGGGLYGGNGDDTIYGEVVDANAAGTGNAGFEDDVFGGNGNDTIYGQSSADRLFGEAGNDHIEGGNGADTINGGDSDDRPIQNGVQGGLYGGSGNDEISGGLGNDWVVGGDDNDTLFGNAGNNGLYGQDGDDVLQGGDDAERPVTGFAGGLYGGPGADHLHGGGGANFLDCGSGTDFYSNGPVGETQQNCETIEP